MGIDIKIRIKKTVLFEDCNDMMLWDYMQITENGNLNHLVKSGKYPKKAILEERMERINKEFAMLRCKENMTIKYDLISYKEELILQCFFGDKLIDIIYQQVLMNIISSKTFNDLITELESWGFYVDREIPMIDALTNIRNEINDIQATINSLEEELNPTEEESPENEQQIGRERFNFHSLLYIYQRILKIDKIKPKELSLTEFAVLEKQVEEEQIKANKINAA